MDPAAQARLIAAKLAASLSAATTGGMAPQAVAPLPPAAVPVDVSDLDPAVAADPAARARAIAARLAASLRDGIGGGGGGSVLGKRKADDAFGWSTGEDSKKRKKISLPDNPEMNYLGLLIGPKVRTGGGMSPV